tara:strand:- start:26 stop:2686 length:2661 start_codon:yes stop_codon:yes gene_type:complete
MPTNTSLQPFIFKKDEEETEALQPFVFADNSPVIPDAQESTSITELAKDQWKQGLVDRALSFVPDSVQNAFQGRPAVDINVAVGSNAARDQDAEDRAATASLLNLDIKNLQPRTVDEQIVSDLARAGSDPMSFLGGVGNKIVKPISAGLESAFGTLTGTLGGETASGIAVGLGAEEGGQVDQSARIVGGGFGGALSAGTAMSGIKAGMAATRAGTNIKNKLTGKVGEAVNEGESYVATSQVANFINDALKSDPKTGDKIAHVEKVLQDFPDLNVGPWIAMTGNPVFKDNLNYLLRTNPIFHGTLKTQIADAEAVIKTRKEALFAKDGPKAETKIFKELEKGLVGAKDVIQNVDKALQVVANPMSSTKVRTPQEIGNIVVKLVDRKKKAVRTQMKPLYNDLFLKAEADGVVFRRDQTEALHTFATTEVKELFGLMPAKYGETIKKWKPTPLRDEAGKVVRGPDKKPLMEYPEASLRQLDSFKRGINEGLRNKNITGDSRARLENMKTQLDTQLADMGDFGAKYKGLDFEYWSRLGIPLSKEGIKQMSTRKFADQVAPLLSRPAQAKEFLDMVGTAGQSVVRASTLAQLSKTAYNEKTGELDILALDKFRNNPSNREIMELSGLKEEFSDISIAVKALDEERAAASTKYIEGSTGHTRQFFGRMNEQGLDGVISDLLTSPAKTQGHIKFIKGLSPESQDIIMTGLRAELSTTALRSGDGAMAFINKNQRTYDEVFGKGMYGNLKSLADVQDLLGGISLDSIKVAAKHSRMQDPLKRKTGVPLSQVSSIARDRIMSGFQKIFVLMNKMNSARVDAKEEQLMIELFTKKGALKEISEAAATLKLDINKPEAIKAFANSINKNISRGAYMGTEAANEEIAREEQVKRRAAR